MKLEVGMYVRTKKGIAKILETYFSDEYVANALVVDKELESGFISSIDKFLCDKKDVISEPSFNIIDLIEVGDYVNGYLVTSINPITIRIEEYNNYWSNKIMDSKDIKSIVTKEQFESMSYKVGE